MTRHKVREAISGTTLTAVVDGTLVVVLLAVLWVYDVRLALVATAFVPVLVASVVVHHPAARRRSREAMETCRRLSAHLVEDVSGVETVKAFGAERTRAEEGEGRLVGLVQAMFSLQKLGHQHEHAGDVRDGAGRDRDPLVRRPPGDGRGADDRPADVLLHAAGLPAGAPGAAGLGEPADPGRAGGGGPAVPGHGPGGRTAGRRQGR